MTGGFNPRRHDDWNRESESIPGCGILGWRSSTHASQVKADRPSTAAANPAASAVPMCHSRAAHSGRSGSVAQVKGLCRSDEVDPVRRGCCILLLHRSESNYRPRLVHGYI